MKHVGICMEKQGEIRLRLSESQASATLTPDGVECRYRGRLSDFYAGVPNCPDRAAVPLKLWLRLPAYVTATPPF